MQFIYCIPYTVPDCIGRPLCQREQTAPQKKDNLNYRRKSSFLLAMEQVQAGKSSSLPPRGINLSPTFYLLSAILAPASDLPPQLSPITSPSLHVFYKRGLMTNNTIEKNVYFLYNITKLYIAGKTILKCRLCLYFLKSVRL
jgi:hypothetical protein